MSASGYKRATKKFAARIDHVDGDASTGFLLVPVGGDFVSAITQAEGFLHFEMAGGEETYISLLSVKRITEDIAYNTRKREAEAEARRAAEEKAQAEAEREAERAREAARKRAERRKSRFTTREEYDALDTLDIGDQATPEEIHVTYRRLVKLYHPDRLRGMGVSDKKIAYAAQRLAEINNAYKVLSKDSRAA